MTKGEGEGLANLSFHLVLDLGNEKHRRLQDLLQTSVSGNSKHVALEMLLRSLPETSDEEANLIVAAIRNRPERQKRGPRPKAARKTSLPGSDHLAVSISTPIAAPVSPPQAPAPVPLSAPGAEEKIVLSEPVRAGEQKNDPGPADDDDDADAGIGMLGRNFGKY